MATKRRRKTGEVLPHYASYIAKRLDEMAFELHKQTLRADTLENRIGVLEAQAGGLARRIEEINLERGKR